MILIVAGSRSITDFESVCRHLDKHALPLAGGQPIEVVSGTAKGVDQLGERWARERGFEITHFPADWKRHGRAAGYRRNTQMAERATHLIAFWDGKSRGTMHMVRIAREKGLWVKVITMISLVDVKMGEF